METLLLFNNFLICHKDICSQKCSNIGSTYHYFSSDCDSGDQICMCANSASVIDPSFNCSCPETSATSGELICEKIYLKEIVKIDNGPPALSPVSSRRETLYFSQCSEDTEDADIFFEFHDGSDIVKSNNGSLSHMYAGPGNYNLTISADSTLCETIPVVVQDTTSVHNDNITIISSSEDTNNIQGYIQRGSRLTVTWTRADPQQKYKTIQGKCLSHWWCFHYGTYSGISQYRTPLYYMYTYKLYSK